MEGGGEAVGVLPNLGAVAVFLEEVGYFLEDMKKDLWWLLRAAHQASGQEFYKGDEELDEVSPEKQAIIDELKKRFQQHAETHENQVRTKIAIIPSVTQEELEVLNALKRLKFHCDGKVEVFLCMKEANNAAIWGAYHTYVASIEPQWMLPSDGAGQKTTFAQCVMVVPTFIDVAKKEIKLLHVWCPDRKKRHWAFSGGDIKRGIDTNIYDAARREFNEEIGSFFGRSWSECFEAELPKDGSEEITDKSCLQFVSIEKDGVRYPCRPYFFVQVKEEFYDSTRFYEDAQGVIKLPSPQGEYVRYDDLEMATRVHLEGLAFAEHEEARWLNLDFATGRLWADDNRQLRRENVDIFKSQPEKIWQWFCDLLGCEMPERAPMLPTDFNADGPFAVRMSGIDKTASNEDIAEFFEAGGSIKTTLVKQFDIPKHTAKIEFESMAMLELALQLGGRTLLRRKVKVELWSDDTEAGGGDTMPGVKPLKEYDGPLPEEGPFKVFCRGLDRTVTRDCLGYFFWDRACLVHDVEFPMKGEKHAGSIEFQDQASLKKALSLNNGIFRGREMTIELNDGKTPPSSAGGGGGGGKGGGGRRDDRDRGERRDKGGGGKGGGKGGGRRDGGYNDRDPPSREEFGSERPRLQLKARSVPIDETGYGERPDDRRGQPPRDAEQAERADPFGGAKPRDDRFKATRADEDSNWRR